ncbi:sugar transferase [Flavobacterium salilacus subsp. salilacus]|uniref:sugar transferase n=1 Tax=Flavobacterium TaxID=237 RepID=UPI00107539BF|nr:MULTISPECIES: sugar transferase [Flavobacterium]KAF2519759.1 sugar transferase [Flavobacterium salilacus subsp. salilacus]MBE1614347.1 sugar transferase [Flavobacterium sp. SaA2.13]
MGYKGKRIFDVVAALVFVLLFGWVLVIFWIVAAITSNTHGLFFQERIGQCGKIFHIYKFETMKNGKPTVAGRFLRKSKLNELPQIFNILLGSMSLVGPRPDIKGYYDNLKGDDRKLLLLKPGITGPASLKYRNEEELLSKQDDAEKYNNEIIFPDKVKINREYQEKMSFALDVKIILHTIYKLIIPFD